MLTAKENMIECMKPGGKPDRFVNQYEAMDLIINPVFMTSPSPKRGQLDVVNSWGVTNSWPENVPGPFPVHTPDKICIKDIEHWRDYVKRPNLKFSQEILDVVKGMCDACDTTKAFKAIMVAPGIFEMTHHLCEMVNAMYYYVDYEDEMKDLIRFLTDWELELADVICSNFHPDMIFHHDDWGSHDSTFLSPSMFDEFLLEPYKEIYGYYKSHGVDWIVHHSDSYAATLVPEMIEMGVDVFQGCMDTNHTPELLKKYGEKITFMGVIENAYVDFEGWTDENNAKWVRKICEENGMKNFIPCIAQGGPGSVYPGVYKSLSDQIDKLNQEKFGFTPEQQNEMRMPIQIMF